MHIFIGKTGRENKRYSTEFKISIIMDMQEHRLGYIKQVQWWERIYLEEGAEGLMKERRDNVKKQHFVTKCSLIFTKYWKVIDANDIIKKNLGGIYLLLFYLSLIESEEDKSKFERLYNRYRKLLKYVAIEMLNDEFLAEDAVHEAFIKLTRYIKGVDENDSHKTKAFVVIIVKSVCVDMLRKGKQDKSFGLEEIDNMGYVNSDSFKNIELQDVYSVIESLSDTYREIIELKVYYNLSDKEIADVLGISNAAVRKRMQRAREILRNKLAERGEDYVSV